MKLPHQVITAAADSTRNFETLQALLTTQAATLVTQTAQIAALQAQLVNGTWQNVGAMTNGWVTSPSTGNPAQYMKDALGFVHLRGTISGGTSSLVAFVLPVGFRPGISDYNGYAAVSQFFWIDTTGHVFPTIPAGGNAPLNGITFLAEN